MTRKEKEIRELKVRKRTIGYKILSGDITQEERNEIEKIIKKIEELERS